MWIWFIGSMNEPLVALIKLALPGPCTGLLWFVDWYRSAGEGLMLPAAGCGGGCWW